MAQDDSLDLAELDVGTAGIELQDENEGSLPEATKPPTNAKELEAVYDIPVQVSAVLGKANMQVSQLLKLGRGAIVELDRKVGEAIDIYVDNRLVARGQVVGVEEDRKGVVAGKGVSVRVDSGGGGLNK